MSPEYRCAVTVDFKEDFRGSDPLAKDINSSLSSQGMDNVTVGRTGKLIEFQLVSPNRKSAIRQIEEMAEKLLANPVIEDWELSSLTAVRKRQKPKK